MLKRRAWRAALLLAIGLTAAGLPSLEASAGSDERTLMSSINSERTKRGLPPLRSAGDLTSVARRHSARMASSRRVYHNPSLGRETSSWRAVGENVGAGSSASKIHNAFMRDPAHREIILERRYTHAGVGVAYHGSTLYVTEVFAVGSGAPAPPRVSKPRRASRRATTRPRPAPVVRPQPPPPPPVRSVLVMLRLLALDEPISHPARRARP